MIVYIVVSFLNKSTNVTLIVSAILYLPIAALGYVLPLTPISYHVLHGGIHLQNAVAFIAGALILSTLHDGFTKRSS